MTLPLESSYILALETAISGGSISLLCNGIAVGSITGNDSLSRAEELLPNIVQLLKENSLSLNQISRVSVSVGPGSYTGIRIGIASAMGLSTSIGCKCAGVPILYAMTLLADKNVSLCLTAVPVGRGDTAYQIFRFNEVRDPQPIEPPSIVSNEDIGKIVSGIEADEVIIHDSLREFLTNIPAAKIILTGDDLASLVGRASDVGSIPDELTPIYLINKDRNKGLF